MFNGNINTEGLFEFSTDLAKEVLKKVKPKSINELIKISSIIHGTGLWENNIEYLIEEHSLNEIACTRDDIYLYLLEKGIDRATSFNIMKFVRKGKATSTIQNYQEEWNNYKKIMKNYNIPEWYISSLEKVRYMFPKAHCCSYVILNLWLAWYKIYYPKEFEEVIKIEEEYC